MTSSPDKIMLIYVTFLLRDRPSDSISLFSNIARICTEYDAMVEYVLLIVHLQPTKSG